MATPAAKKASKPKETAHQRFVRLGNARANKALNAISLLRNLSGRSYEYTVEDVNAVTAALRAEIDAVESKLTTALSGPQAKAPKEARTVIS